MVFLGKVSRLQERALQNLGQEDSKVSWKKEKNNFLPKTPLPYHKATKIFVACYTLKKQNASLYRFILERR